MGGGGGGGVNHKADDSPLFWGNHGGKHQRPIFSKYMICLLFFILISAFYTINNFLYPSCPSSSAAAADTIHLSSAAAAAMSSTNQSLAIPGPPPPTPTLPPPPPEAAATGLQHIVFGIAASAQLWNNRKEYIKVWWRPREMRGFVWLDKPVKPDRSSAAASLLPTIKISGDTSKLPYTHGKGSRSALRISRIVSETHRLSLPDVRWYVMGDDDTVFFPENLVAALSRLDHRQPYYIGSPSESHVQNIIFSYGMAYGGGGFAISAALAAELSKIQDRCIRRYPSLYGSDDRMHACMAELGVPLTRHPGFHQCDLYGDLLGLLAAHPVAPLISIHHLDVVRPIFPDAKTKPAALRRLFEGPVRLDSAGIVQQSICYDGGRRWTVSVSWGFVVMVVKGVMAPREMETPARTFLNWYQKADYTGWSFNTRPVARNPCQKPYVYYLKSARYDVRRKATVTEYALRRENHPPCRWNTPSPPDHVERILVYKKPDPGLWERSPRRNCCRIVKDAKEGKKTMAIDVGVCRAGEFSDSEG